MSNRIIGFLNKSSNKISEAALLLGGFAFISQILGLIRDRMLAYIVGAGPSLDVYYAAFRIPDFLYVSIASLASVTVVMPFIVEKMKDDKGGKEKAQIFLNNVFSSFLIFILGASIIMFFVMPYIAHYIAPGFTTHQMKLMITVSRIMLLSPIFIGLSNLIGTITQLYKNFFVFSLSPVFYNIGILTGIIFLYPILGVYGLGIGVIVGAILHLLVQAPVVASHKFLPKFVRKIDWMEMWRVARLSLPRTLALSSNSIAFMVLIAMASTLKAGSISLFTFSYNLQSVPVGIIGISYSVAAFPTLVKSFSNGNIKAFINYIMNTARQIIFWSIPVITLLIVLRAQIVRVILGSHRFTWSDTRLTAAAVALFIVSLVTQGLVLLFVRGYYAAGNTKKPVIVNVLSSGMVVILAFLFVHIFRSSPNLLSNLDILLRVKDVPGTIMLSLPLAYAGGSILNFFLIWFLFRRDFFHKSSLKLWPTFIQSILGSIAIGVVTYLSLGVFDDIFNLKTFYGIFLQGLISGILGILAGITVLLLLKNKELHGIIKTLSHKLRSDQVVAPGQADL